MKKLLIVSSMLAACAAGACDMCAIYSAQDAQTGDGWNAGVFEQFTHSTTLRDNGEKIDNAGLAKLDSSTTQIIAGYRFNELFGLQLNVPYLHRSYERPNADGTARESGTEQGIGDAVVLANARVFKAGHAMKNVAVNLLGGVKLPTGDTGRLKDQPELELPEGQFMYGGLHNHDLALGSGSYDYLFGASLGARADRWFLRGQIQYDLRTRGDYGYQFASDLTWAVAPGYSLWLDDAGSLGLALNINGENKGEDNRNGEADDDTAMNATYAGPALTFTRGETTSGELALDLPVQQHNSGGQIVPDFRIRAAITARF